MHVLGIDLGTSFIKCSVLDTETQETIESVQWPEAEMKITSLKQGWAEQSPADWWRNIQAAIKKLEHKKEVAAIGVAYQMHGLVLVDKNKNILRDAIIWCDSRATDAAAYPMGNFTAGKLSWVEKNEPEIFSRVHKFMLPGDFITMKMTGEMTTTPSALSEGMFWSFEKNTINCHGFDSTIFPSVHPVFSNHGHLLSTVAEELGLRSGIPVSYKAGDQSNNALSLDVLRPGEFAATAGTSGVIYGVTDKTFTDKYQRINSFVHVNGKIGALLCINGTGIMNNWIKILCERSYAEMDAQAAAIEPGSDGLMVMPFGNGAERMLENRSPGARIINIDLNRHSKAQIYRSVQEGIAFAFRYGVDIMRANGLHAKVIRAPRANMFLSDVFCNAFVHACETPLELFEPVSGAAIGAAIGIGMMQEYRPEPVRKIEPAPAMYARYENCYHQWKAQLLKQLN